MNPIVLLIPVFFFCLSLSAKLRPNVIVVLVDDMGYSDLGSFGGEVQTPKVVAQGGKYDLLCVERKRESECQQN